MVVKITSSKGVQRIESNPERYLDVSPKLVPGGRKKRPIKISNEPKFKITGLRTPKPEPEIHEEEIPKEEVKQSDFVSKYVLCNGFVSNTHDLFDVDESIKCMIVDDKDGNPIMIDGNYIVIDMIQDRELNTLSIVTKESLDTLTGNFEELNHYNESLSRNNEELDTQLSDAMHELEENHKKCEELESRINELLSNLENEINTHNVTKSELEAMKIVNNSLQKQIDDLSNSTEEVAEIEIDTGESTIIIADSNSENLMSFNVASPLFTSEETVQESIEDLKSDIEDKDIVDIIDRALPDGEDALLTKPIDPSEDLSIQYEVIEGQAEPNDANTFDKSKYTNVYDSNTKSFVSENEFVVEEVTEVPVGLITNPTIIKETTEEIKEMEQLGNEESIPVITASYSNNTIEVAEEYEPVHMTQKIVIPDSVKEEIANAGKAVSEENKRKEKDFKWRQEQKRKKKGKKGNK